MPTNQNENKNPILGFISDEKALHALRNLLEFCTPDEALKILDDDAHLHSWGHNNNFSVSSSQAGLNYYLKRFFWALLHLQLQEEAERQKEIAMKKFEVSAKSFIPPRKFSGLSDFGRCLN